MFNEVPDAMLPQDFLLLLPTFSQCFTAPTFQRFVTVVTGWILCVGKHTVTGVLRGAGVVGKAHHSGYHWFFSGAKWATDKVGLALLGLVLKLVPAGETVTVTVDDTLARHKGKHIHGAAFHRDPMLSGLSKVAYSFGHCWVVLGVVVVLQRWEKAFCLPVLVRLYRPKNLCTGRGGAPYRKKTELVAEMVALLANALGNRRFVVLGDQAYVNSSVVRRLPASADIVGRARMDAALYAPPPRNRKPGPGRPRIKGERLPSPAQRISGRKWRTVRPLAYGRRVRVQVQVFDALWYIVGHGRLMRFVLIRGWPGHNKPDLLVTTDTTMTAEQVITRYCHRWSIEETFRWAKGRLGFEDPQSRTEGAVTRTAPMALWVYSLVVLWYARWSKRRTTLPFRPAPWNTTKTTPSFSDMLAALRRQSWMLLISDPAAPDRFDQKHLAPLLDAASYG